MELNIAQTKLAVQQAIEAGLVPRVLSAPGVGKSTIVKQIAKEGNLELIDVRLAQCEPTDLLGLPNISGERATYLPMDIFPLEGDELPKGKNGWLLFLDELSNANVHVQHAAYRIILDKEVGNHKLHPNCYIVAAGNREEDNCFVQPTSAALITRMVTIHTTVQKDTWIDWANAAGIDPRITAFIEFSPDSLNQKEKPKKEESFACPRTWEFADKIIQGKKDINDIITKTLLEGILGKGTALNFTNFTEHFSKIAKYSEVIADPMLAKVPRQNEMALQYATVGMLVGNFDIKDTDPVMNYLDRLDTEFQMVFVKSMIKRCPQIITHKRLQPWTGKIANMMRGV